MAKQNVNPGYKGNTLPQSGVEPYNYHESNKDPNERLGQLFFLAMYIMNAMIAYVFGYFLYPLLLKVYDSEVERDQDFPFPVQFLTVTGIYFIVLYLADFIYYCYNWNNLNVFIILKMIAMIIPIINWVRLIAVKNDISIKVLVHVGLLTLAIVLLILSVFPTLLLFFAHPMNTFTLLVTHIVLIYTETIIGMLVIERLNKCECSKCGEVILLIVLMLILVLILILVYVIVMCLYHILFLRSLINNLAFDIFVKYIPSVVIAVFGYMYLIQQGTFFNKKKMETKRRNSSQS